MKLSERELLELALLGVEEKAKIIRSQLNGHTRTTDTVVNETAQRAPKRRRMSAAARKRIGEATKKRWAELRKKKNNAPK